MSKNPLDNIYYISIPEEFTGKFENLTIDKDIKLPIETENIADFKTDSLSWEMIISAMLKILAYDPEHKDIEYFREFVKSVRPNIVEELTNSAIFKSQAKDFQLAKEIFLAIQGLTINNDRNLLNLAVVYEAESDTLVLDEDNEYKIQLLEQAGRIYTELLNRDSVLTDVYFNAGYYFIKIREYEKGNLFLESFITYSDDEEKIKKAQEVINHYKNLSGNEELFNEAYGLILNEREAEAITLLQNFIEENSVWNAWFLIGWANRRLSNFTEAVMALNRAIELNDSDSDTYNELAICHMESGNFIESQKALEKALAITPEDVKIISNMGILQLKMGNKNEASKFFETVLIYEPEDTIAKHYLDQII